MPHRVRHSADGFCIIRHTCAGQADVGWRHPWSEDTSWQGTVLKDALMYVEPICEPVHKMLSDAQEPNKHDDVNLPSKAALWPYHAVS